MINNPSKNRHLYIGGSDISAIMGMNRWKTPLSLWAEKTLKLPAPDLSNVEAVELGSELEEFVAKKFTKKTGKAVRRSPKVYTHPEYPYMVAHIDRLVTRTDELLECKTCSAFKKSEWKDDEIPQEYILQVIWYLGITGRKTGYIAVLIGGQSFKYKKIDFDAELFEAMVESAKEFWGYVQNDIPPKVMADDDATLKELYSTHNDIIIDLTAESAAEIIEEKIAYLQEIKSHSAELEKERKEIESTIKDIIKDNLGLKTLKYEVTWKAQNKTSLDTALLKEEEPEIFSKYSTKTNYRVIRINKNKEFEVA